MRTLGLIRSPKSDPRGHCSNDCARTFEIIPLRNNMSSARCTRENEWKMVGDYAQNENWEDYPEE